jgi:hypothetical protein
VPELSGTVVLADGRPAAGARVRLARGEARTDGGGRFHLPLRGVEDDSVLEVEGEGHAPHVERHFGRRLRHGGSADTGFVVLDRPLDTLAGRLVGSTAAQPGWRVLAFAQGAVPEGEPVTAVCGTDGSFELVLPRGSHRLFALAPDFLASVALELPDSRVGHVEIQVGARPRVQERVALQSEEGGPLAEASVELVLELEEGREAVWGALSSNAAGVLAFERAPEARVRLAVRHASLGPLARAASLDEPVLARASTVRVQGAHRTFTALALLGADGSMLDGLGPLGPEHELTLEGGASATYVLPPEARWALFSGADGETLRVPLEPLPGTLLTLTP